MKKESKINFTKLTQKKGISLIVLIVTIIVIIILAAAVILTLSKNNPIESAREATFKEDVRAFQDELALSISKEYTEKQGQRDKKITASDFDEIKKYIPSFTKKYEGKFVIENDKLVGVEELTEKEIKWSKDISVVVSIKEPSIDDPVFDPEKWDETATSEDCFYWDGTTITGFIPEKLSGVTKVRIPSKCTAIRSDYAFGGTEDYRNFVAGITTVEIPETVTEIGSYAFHNFTKLTSINIPDSVKRIGQQAFSCCSSLTSITIPNSVTSIECRTFEYCNSITNIIMPSYLTSIGNSAFEGCCSLTSITIPEGIENIDITMLSGCSSLTNVIVAKENKNYDSRENCNAIINSSTNELIFGCKNTIIPVGVKSIGENAFYGCSGLTSITIPESVTSIEAYSFEFCRNLKSVTMPESIIRIGNSAFSYCNSLTSITIPEKVTNIGNNAFNNCESLESITIPNSVTSIEYMAFSDCYNLIINCRVESEPSGWHYNWNPDNRPVNWGYTGE